jgi:hypothetical protein
MPFYRLFLEKRVIPPALTPLINVLVRLFIVHVITCAYLIIGKLCRQANLLSLLDDEELDNSGFFDKHIFVLHLVVVTLSTVGFGNTVPKNQYERAFS